MSDIERDEYLKVRSDYDKEKSQQAAALDKYILTISTGSFGLSFLFIEKIVHGEIQHPRILVFSWVMFVLSIVSSLLSFIFSKNAISKTIEEYDKMYNEGSKEFKIPIEDNFTKIFNWYAFGFLILGFISFIVFSYFNVTGV